MKVLIDAQLGNLVIGLGRAFEQMGFSTVCWHHAAKPAFDMFAEFDPTVFIGCPASMTNRAIKKNLDMRPDLKAVIYEDYIPLLAFDSITFKTGRESPKFKCDAVHMGKYEAWKLDYIAPLIKAGHTVKIFSSDPWPIPEALGNITVEEIPDAHASAVVSLCLGAQPQDDYYRAIGCGGLPLSSYQPPCGPNYFGQSQVSPQGFATECLAILKEPKDWMTSKRSQKQAVMINDTYMRRASEILNELNKDTK